MPCEGLALAVGLSGPGRHSSSSCFIFRALIAWGLEDYSCTYSRPGPSALITTALSSGVDYGEGRIWVCKGSSVFLTDANFHAELLILPGGSIVLSPGQLSQRVVFTV